MIQGLSYGAVSAPWWDDRPVFLVGGGPSLIGFDFSRLAPLGHVIGVNQAMFEVPGAEVGVSMDRNFIKNKHAELQRFAQNRVLYLSVDPAPSWLPLVQGACYLKHDNEPGLSLDCRVLKRGSTSGYVALNIAVLKRAKQIVMLGYDYGENASGDHHWHDAYYWFTKGEAQSWGYWATHYKAAAPICRRLGIQVINASINSRIDAFSKFSIEGALKCLSSKECTA